MTKVIKKIPTTIPITTKTTTITKMTTRMKEPLLSFPPPKLQLHRPQSLHPLKKSKKKEALLCQVRKVLCGLV
jgi:hypothetical protein